MKNYKLEEVFGISRKVPLNYIRRKHVDDQLEDCLNRKQHIVIYGSSKQGKTCLRKNSLSEDRYITVQCSNQLDILKLNQLILKNTGFEITTSHNRTISGKAKAKVSFGINLFGKIGGETEAEGGLESQKVMEPIDLDLEDTNDIIRVLKSINFKKFIVLDDFHYLKPQTQKDFAIALKGYYENSDFCFIITGVWLEKNRLIALNGDLAGRIIPIDAEIWSADDLKKVIDRGLELLNIQFAEELIDEIIEESFDSVYIVQEICYRVCSKFKIKNTLDEVFFIGNKGFISDTEGSILRPDESFSISGIVKDIINQHSGRYNSFLMQFSDGLQNSEIESYKWLLYPILCTEVDELMKGLTFNYIRNLISEKQLTGKKVNAANLSLALNSLTNIQIEKNITPNILDYDQTNLRLNIVDKEFLIWLSYQDKPDLFICAGFED